MKLTRPARRATRTSPPARTAPFRPPRDAGMSTAEYAVGTLAATALAALLYEVVSSGAVSDALQRLVERALDAPQ